MHHNLGTLKTYTYCINMYVKIHQNIGLVYSHIHDLDVIFDHVSTHDSLRLSGYFINV